MRSLLGVFGIEFEFEFDFEDLVPILLLRVAFGSCLEFCLWISLWG